jgi:hypothetical protein
VKPPGAGLAVFGVAAFDAADEATLTVWVKPGLVLPLTSGAAITAPAVVMTDAAGKAVPFTISATNVPCGIALDTVAGADLEVMVLFRPHLVADTIV